MSQYIIGEPQFIQNLEGWLAKNDQKHADYFFRNKSGIPPMFRQYNNYLYRGMRVNDEQYESIQKTGLTFTKHTSWTKHPSLAKKFADDPTSMVGAARAGDIKIMIKKKISPANIIFDIHSFILFMGIKQLEMLGLDELAAESASEEDEVLISRGLRISKNDISTF